MNFRVHKIMGYKFVNIPDSLEKNSPRLEFYKR